MWFWPILLHRHKQSSNIEGSVGLFYELWSLGLSIDCLLDSSEVIGWAILAALFSFSETNWEFPWLCIGLLSCWNVHPCFIFIIQARFISVSLTFCQLIWFKITLTHWNKPGLFDKLVLWNRPLVGVGTEPANINVHWQGVGLLSNYWLAFYAFLHLPFFMCSIPFPVSFHFITHNLISELICFVFFVCMYVFVCYRHLVKISCQQHL